MTYIPVPQRGEKFYSANLSDTTLYIFLHIELKIFEIFETDNTEDIDNKPENTIKPEELIKNFDLLKISKEKKIDYLKVKKTFKQLEKEKFIEILEINEDETVFKIKYTL